MSRNVSRSLSVRRTPTIDAALSDIMRVTDAESTTEAVARALDLYAHWLQLQPGATVMATGHTRRRTP
ncbi:hypothetical protein OHA59_30325 [Streptomyces sp. NBC_01589]|uniref:hypothetical protein n=1 Tax=Streptomyces sp. NBC_01589 TaxID=2975886 RepID=UPI003866C807